MATTIETWRHGDIMTNGIRMHYVIQGKGPLMVLLHGFPEFWYSWHHQIPFLAEHGYTVVAPDLRGYNDTDKPRKGYDVPTLRRDIEGLIKGLGYERAIIVGHDWGGALAWSFAMHYQQMTERLIVLNAPHPYAMARELRTVRQLQKSWYMFFFQIPWLPEFLLGLHHAWPIGRMLSDTSVQKTAFPPEKLLKYREAMNKPGALTASINYYRALFRRPRRRLNTAQAPGEQAQSIITVPMLLIWGEQDVALGINLTDNLEQWVPNILVRRLAASGHWVQQEMPDTVNTLMIDFLQHA